MWCFVPNGAYWNLSVLRKASGYYLPCPFDQVSWDQKTWASSKAEAALAWRIPDASGDAGFGTSIALCQLSGLGCQACCCCSFSALLLLLQFSFYQLSFSFEHQLYAMIYLSSDSHSKSSSQGQHFQIFDRVQPLELNVPAMIQSWDGWPFTYNL